MGLNIDVLFENKKVFNPDEKLMNANQGIWNLTNSSITFNNVRVQVREVYYVTDDDQMRPDLIAYYRYSNQGRMGTLLKFNGYSNPFSLDTGQILYIPLEKSITDGFDSKKNLDKKGNTNSSPSNAFKKAQESKISKPSEGRKKYVENKIKNKPAQVLPPNMTQPGEQTVIRKDGKIIFAPNSGGGGYNKPSNL
jgi:hypothetical protein